MENHSWNSTPTYPINLSIQNNKFGLNKGERPAGMSYLFISPEIYFRTLLQALLLLALLSVLNYSSAWLKQK
jgi:hypothetical protein